MILRQDQVSSNENILIHGIGGSTQSSGVEPADALLRFLQFIGKDQLVAYHAFFDQAMIDKAMIEYLGSRLGQSWIDLAWVLPDLFQYRNDNRVALDDWLQLFGLDPGEGRRSPNENCLALARLFQMLVVRAHSKGVDTVAALIEESKASSHLRRSH